MEQNLFSGIGVTAGGGGGGKGTGGVGGSPGNLSLGGVPRGREAGVRRDRSRGWSGLAVVLRLGYPWISKRGSKKASSNKKVVARKINEKSLNILEEL